MSDMHIYQHTETPRGPYCLYGDVAPILEHRAQLLAALKEHKRRGSCSCDPYIEGHECNWCRDFELISSIEAQTKGEG